MNDDLVLAVNVLAYVLLATAAAWAVLSPAVDDGVVPKLGLILISLGFAGLAGILTDSGWCSDARLLGRAMLMVHGGIGLLLLGWLLRTRRSRNKRRRMTDWAHRARHGVDGG